MSPVLVTRLWHALDFGDALATWWRRPTRANAARLTFRGVGLAWSLATLREDSRARMVEVPRLHPARLPVQR